jgi:acyl-CoA synthetase (NDP forming)
MATRRWLSSGLEMAKLSDATKKAPAKDLRPTSVANPVDMLGYSTGDDYAFVEVAPRRRRRRRV